MTNGRMAGKVAVVTGAGSGIGKASAILLAAEGAKVALLELTTDTAEETKQEIEKAGGEAFAIECDVSRPESVQAAVRRVGETWGRIDVVFANAGINGAAAPIETMEIEDWNRTLETNLRGTFATVKYSIPYLKKQGGSVVITSSINGSRAFSGTGFSAYSSSKAGQVAFAKMAALELARYKIRVNVICPGAIETNIGKNTFPSDDLKKIAIPVEYPEGSHPLEGRPGKPEEVAKLVLFLGSDDSSHISGTEIFVDGAESLL
ncbi:SDR family oxidoreductase [Saccharibacillus endophyticus]|uniref:3-ketoacyl-ACP reductase n=1 Tax=Saccharibacillus endophyticus TaxID=2060666 RepID=A0ABQ1ZT06_9BACL|nr:SDR family NAD(P)-dependent oxidoreductase [Saccharibacillus endophyticus]GGH74721.1 3-ketoacyl-ACP reductase [Saccharibacillus endophyticus]